MNGVSLLRQEFPALALILGFIPSSEREPVANILLLWLELRRASQASEQIVAATRIAWWRDALEANDGKGVPLAENLLAGTNLNSIAVRLADLVERTLTEENTTAHHHLAGQELATLINQPVERLTAALIRLDNVLEGGRMDRPDRTSPDYSRHVLPGLIHWLCDTPTRLAYPERHPMLVFAMVLAAVRL